MGLTKDTLRPRSDVGRGRRSGVEKDAAWPGSNQGTRLRGVAAAWEMKRTQPGPGDPLCIDLGDYGERKRGQSTKSSSQTGAWGSCGQFHRNHAADVRNRPGRTPTRACPVLDTGVSEGPKRQSRSNRCECVLRGDYRESEAQSFRSDPWVTVGRAWLDPSGTSRAKGKDPQVSKAKKHWKSLITISVLRPIAPLAIPFGPHRPKCSLQFDKSSTKP